MNQSFDHTLGITKQTDILQSQHNYLKFFFNKNKQYFPQIHTTHQGKKFAVLNHETQKEKKYLTGAQVHRNKY